MVGTGAIKYKGTTKDTESGKKNTQSKKKNTKLIQEDTKTLHKDTNVKTVERLLAKNGWKYLVKWANLSDDENTWEHKTAIPKHILNVRNYSYYYHDHFHKLFNILVL